MQYYRLDLKAYATKTPKLSLLQHGVYFQLLNAIYDRERFPTRAEAVDWIWISNPDEEAALDFILYRFFEEDSEGHFINNAAVEVIDEYHAFCETQRINGKKGGRPKKPNGLNKKPDGAKNKPDHNPSPLNKKPSTITNTNTNTNNTTADKSADGFEAIWDLYEKKGNRKTALSRYSKLSLKSQTALINIIPAYVQRTPDKQFRKGLEVFINGECWNDELPPEKTVPGNGKPKVDHFDDGWAEPLFGQGEEIEINPIRGES